MGRPETGNEPSMEDILASIRKMISDDTRPPARNPFATASPAADVISAPAHEPAAPKSEGFIPSVSAAPQAIEQSDIAAIDADLMDIIGDGSSETIPEDSKSSAQSEGAETSPAFVPASSSAPVMPAPAKSIWGMKRNGFIPGYERVTPELDGLSGKVAPSDPVSEEPAASVKADLMPEPFGKRSPLGNGLGGFVPAQFGKSAALSDDLPVKSSPFPNLPKRLPGDGTIPGNDSNSFLPASVRAPQPQSFATDTKPPAPLSTGPSNPFQNTADAELAALADNTMDEPAIASASSSAPSVLFEQTVSRPPWATLQIDPLPTNPLTPSKSSLASATLNEPVKLTAAPAEELSTSSRSLEEVVSDLLRPMLKSWLDANMPRMVETALRKEISGFDGGFSSRTNSDRPQ